MRKTTIALGAALVLALAGCMPDEEDKLALSTALPKGCTATHIENYGSIDLLVIVVCDDKNVTSTASADTKTQGKTTSKDNGQTVVVGGN